MKQWKLYSISALLGYCLSNQWTRTNVQCSCKNIQFCAFCSISIVDQLVCIKLLFIWSFRTKYMSLNLNYNFQFYEKQSKNSAMGAMDSSLCFSQGIVSTLWRLTKRERGETSSLHSGLQPGQYIEFRFLGHLLSQLSFAKHIHKHSS